MVRKMICKIALVAALIPLVYQSAWAQAYTTSPPKQTIQQYGPFTSATFKSASTSSATGKSLFYGGDFLYNPAYPPSLPNGLANENTEFISGVPYGAAVWVPFTVSGKDWNVTGLFTNNLSLYGVLDQGPAEPAAAAYWAINTGVSAGDSGTPVAGGIASAATSTLTGRSAFGLTEYTVQVTGLTGVTLAPGSYWMIVVPICTNTADPYCTDVFFESDVEYINVTPKNAVGPAEPVDASYFDSPVFGYSFGPTWGPLGACFGFGCDAFSAGVLGKH